MTALDIIKTEYMLYELEAIPSSRDETIKVVDLFIGDMDDTISSSKTAMHENFRDEQITKVKNFFLDLFGYEGEDVEQFGHDTGIVFRHSCLADRYKDYFNRMKGILSDDNYVDICKLAMFTYQSYTSNYRYLESLRDSIKFATDGVTYYGAGEDTQAEFSEFFDGVFEGMTKKNKVYRKKEENNGKK